MVWRIYDRINEIIFMLYRGAYVTAIGVTVLVAAVYLTQHELRWECLIVAVALYAMSACLSFDSSYREYRLKGRSDEDGDFAQQSRKLMDRAVCLFVCAVVFYAFLRLSHISSLLPYSVVISASFAGFTLAIISLLASSVAMRNRMRRHGTEPEGTEEPSKKLPLFSACGLWAKCLLVLAIVGVMFCCALWFNLHSAFPESIALVAGSVALLVFCYYAMRIDMATVGFEITNSDAFGWMVDVALIDCVLLGAILLLIV